MVFQEMKPEDARKAMEGHPDVLAPALEQHKEYFKRLSCHRCGGDVLATVNTAQLFKNNVNLPNYLAKCKTCGCEFEPYTQIEVKGPDKAKGV